MNVATDKNAGLVGWHVSGDTGKYGSEETEINQQLQVH